MKTTNIHVYMCFAHRGKSRETWEFGQERLYLVDGVAVQLFVEGDVV